MSAVNGPLRSFRLLWDLAWLRSRRNWQLAQKDDKAILGTVFMALMVLVVTAVQYQLAYTLLELVEGNLDPMGMLSSAPESVLAIFLALGGGLALLLGVFRANDVLYLRSDLGWAMALPVDRRGVVLARVAETALGVAGPVALMSGPSMLAYVSLYHAWYILALCPLFIVGLSALGSTAAMLVMILAGGMAPTSRRREAVGLIGSIAGALMYLFFMLRSQMGGNLVETLARGLAGILAGPAAALAAAAALPFVWPALAVRFISWGPVSTGMVVLAAGISGTAVAVWATVAAGAGAYARGLGRSGSANARRLTKPPASRHRAAMSKVPVRAVPVQAGALGALARRDWAILTRSPRLWQPMAMPLAWVVYMMVSRPPFPSGDPLIMGALAALAAAVSAGMLAQMSFGAEGGSFFHLSTLPLSPLSRVTSKALVFALPAAAVGLILAGVLLRGAGTPADLLRAAALIITAALTMTSVTLALTVGDTNFEPEKLGQMQSAETGCLSMLLTGGIVALAYVVLMASRDLGRRLGAAPGTAATLGVAVVAAICFGAIIPAALRKAADAVRARGRGASPQA